MSGKSRLHFIYLGNFAEPHNTECYIADALSAAGCTVDRLQESDFDSKRLIQRVGEICDQNRMVEHRRAVLLFAKGRLTDTPFNNPGPLVDVLKILRNETAVDVIACWIFDLLCSEFSPSRFIWGAEVSRACDIFFTTDGYTARGGGLSNAIILRQAMPAMPRAGNFRATFACDVAHIGSVYGDRNEWHVELLRAFGDGYKRFEDIRGDDLFDVCASAKVVVGPGYPHFDHYWSNRIYLAAGYGACFACPRVDGMRADGWHGWQEYCRNEERCTYFRLPLDTKPAIDHLKWLVSGDPEPVRLRQLLRSNAQALVTKSHLYSHRIAEMLNCIDAKLAVTSGGGGDAQ